MASEEKLPDLVARIRMDLAELDKGLAAVKQVGTEAERAGGSNAFAHVKAGLQRVDEQAKLTIDKLARVTEIVGGIAGGGVFGHSAALLGALNLPLAGAISGVLGLVEGLNDLSKATAAYSSEVLRNSEFLGINTREMQGLLQLGDLLGIQTSAMERGLVHFQKVLQDGGKQVDALGFSLKSLGITSSDTGEAIYQAADALSRIQNPIERNTVGTALFGARQLQLVEALTHGSAMLKEYEREMAGLGLILDDTQLKAGAAADLINTKFDLAMKGLKQTVGADLEGAFTQLWSSILNAFGDQSKQGIDRIKSGIDAIAQAIANAVGWVVSFIQGLLNLNQMFGAVGDAGIPTIQAFKEAGGAADATGDAIGRTAPKVDGAAAALDRLRESTRLATQALDDQITVIRQQAQDFTAAIDAQVKALHDQETALQQQVKMSELLQQHQDEQHQSYLSHLEDELAALNATTGAQRTSGESLTAYQQKLRKQELAAAIQKEKDARAEHKTSTEIMLENLKIATTAQVAALDAQKKAEKDTTDDLIKQLEHRKQELDRHLQSVEAANRQSAQKQKDDQLAAASAIGAGHKAMTTGIQANFINLSESARRFGQTVRMAFQGAWDFITGLVTGDNTKMQAGMSALGDVLGAAIATGLIHGFVNVLIKGTEGPGKWLYKAVTGQDAPGALPWEHPAQNAFEAQGATVDPQTGHVTFPKGDPKTADDRWHKSGHSGPPPPGYASGGFPKRHIPFLAGERGPELITLNHDARVFNAAQTAQILGGGQSQPIVFNITYEGPQPDEYVMRESMDRLVSEVRRRGVLGSLGAMVG